MKSALFQGGDPFPSTGTGLVNAHGNLLGDPIRDRAFLNAILATVRAGDVVLDVGTGTGYLAYLACKAGASKVYAVERHIRAINLARGICRHNGFEKKVEFIHGSSRKITLPEKVDVIISETIGYFGFDEGIAVSLADARTRLLKPGGRVIPESLRLHVAPIEAPKVHRAKVGLWHEGLNGVNFSTVLPFSLNNPHVFRIKENMLLGAGEALPNFILLSSDGASYEGTVKVKVSRGGKLHGIGMWFSSQLTKDISLTNDPACPRTHWAQGILLAPEAIAVREGEVLEVTVRCDGNGRVWRWDVSRV